MKNIVMLFLLFHHGSAVAHSLKYLYSSTGVSNLSEIVAVGLVDEVQAFHYDSSTRRCRPTQEWTEKASEDDPKFWQKQTEDVDHCRSNFKANIETVKQHLNQTEGIHVFQWISGCDWDDETNEVDGYERIGYDGEDMFSYDLETEKWNVSNNVIIKTWDYDKDLIAQGKHHLTAVRLDWLKMYLNYGLSSLTRTGTVMTS